MNLDQILKELGKEGDIPNLENNELNVDSTEKEKRAEELYTKEHKYGILTEEYEALEKIYNQIKTDQDFDTFYEKYIKNNKISIENGHVVYLNLSFTQVNDINPVKGLVNLRGLDLFYTKVSDISPIENLVNLEYLSFSCCKLINSIDSIKYLKKLKKLSISSTSVKDMSSIENLKDLEELYFDGAPIKNISPIENLMNLKVVYFYDTQVSDISPIENLKNLEKFYLGKQVKDISLIANLKNIKELGILFMRIEDIKDINPIENLENLKILNLKGSYVNPSDLTTKSIIDKLKHRNVKVII